MSGDWGKNRTTHREVKESGCTEQRLYRAKTKSLTVVALWGDEWGFGAGKYRAAHQVVRRSD